MINYEKINSQTVIILRKVFLFCILIILSGRISIAQEMSVTLSNQSLSRREAITEIKNQTDYHFAINHSSFDEDGIVHFKKRIIPLHEALSQLLSGTGQTYIINGKQILIFSTQEGATEENTESEKPKEQNTHPAKKENYHYPATTPTQEFVPYNRSFEEELKKYNSRPFTQQPEQSTQIVQPKQSEQFEQIQQPKQNESNTYKREATQTKSKSYISSGTSRSYPLRQFEAVPTGKHVANNLPYFNSVPSRFSIKTNVLYGLAALTPNLGVEIGLTPKTSIDLSVGWNPFNKKGSEESNKKLMHFLIKPEFRYWLCERSNGHFFGIHPFYADYNISEREVPLLFKKEYRYEGDAFGIGVSYGYHWMLNKHWGIEFNAGVGAAFLKYSKFKCEKCSDKIGDFKKKYFGPTSLGIKLVYILK